MRTCQSLTERVLTLGIPSGKGPLACAIRVGVTLLVFLRLGTAAPSVAEVALQEAMPRETYAVLINGGGSAATNYLSHLHHLQDMVTALRSRGVGPKRITVFSGDGDDPAKDLAVREEEPPNSWLIHGTDAGRTLCAPALTNTVWEGVPLRPARLSELRRWFVNMGKLLLDGDTLLLFVTDHGTRSKGTGGEAFISLWHESLSVPEFRELLGYLPPGVRVVSVMSQCYSGAFADPMPPHPNRVPGGNVCGFYSTTEDRRAYGCYAEARDRDRIGHAFHFIDAMDRHASLDAVHDTVLMTDTSPDVPIRTSDVFLEQILQDEASLRRVGLEELVDGELALAWKDRRQWEPYVRLLDRIGDVYGTISPRALAELKPRFESLQSLSKEIGTYELRWRVSLDDLRKENLDRFMKELPTWKDRLGHDALQRLDKAGRSITLALLLPALSVFTKGRSDVWERLEDLHRTDEDAKSAEYRVDVRLAALMRMRTLLIRIAGIQFLSQNKTSPEGQTAEESRLSEMRNMLSTIRDCEATRLGTFDPSREKSVSLEASKPLPPFDEDLTAVRRALPSWLGIRFRPVSHSQRESFEIEAGAVMVEDLYPGPAAEAGLKVGDIVLGPPEGHFTEPNQIGEWTISSPREMPLALDVLRNGEKLQVTVSLIPYPTKLPELQSTLRAGDHAPGLGSLRILRSGKHGDEDLSRRRHLLFFWATWCDHCKSSLPELMDWSKRTGIPVVAVSDEDEEAIRSFLISWTGPFPDFVASDKMRATFLSYGISGTPTFILVDDHETIEWRQVGYSAESRHLAIPGWSWTDDTR